MITVSYDYFKYLGSLDEDTFNRCIKRARVKLDYKTFGRVSRLTDEDDEDLVSKVKDCLCALSEKISQYSEPNGVSSDFVKTSESLGPHSVSYVVGSDSNNTPIILPHHNRNDIIILKLEKIIRNCFEAGFNQPIQCGGFYSGNFHQVVLGLQKQLATTSVFIFQMNMTMKFNFTIAFGFHAHGTFSVGYLRKNSLSKNFSSLHFFSFLSYLAEYPEKSKKPFCTRSLIPYLPSTAETSWTT